MVFFSALETFETSQLRIACCFVSSHMKIAVESLTEDWAFLPVLCPHGWGWHVSWRNPHRRPSHHSCPAWRRQNRMIYGTSWDNTVKDSEWCTTQSIFGCFMMMVMVMVRIWSCWWSWFFFGFFVVLCGSFRFSEPETTWEGFCPSNGQGPWLRLGWNSSRDPRPTQDDSVDLVAEHCTWQSVGGSGVSGPTAWLLMNFSSCEKSSNWSDTLPIHLM